MSEKRRVIKAENYSATDILNMLSLVRLSMLKLSPKSLLFLGLIAAQTAFCESISLGAGYSVFQHQYLEDAATSTNPIGHANIDLGQWRWRQSGFLARGPIASISTGSQYRRYSGQLPLYLWTLHEGLWVGLERSSIDTTTTLSENKVYLSEDGVQSTLSKGADITSTWSQQTTYVLWRNQSRYPGVINWAAIFRETISSPAAAEIESSSALWFDGEFRGRGIIVGRESDHRGHNFQWQLQMGQYKGQFSDSQTGQLVQDSEKTEINFGFRFGWHFQWYLAPYWYLVPSIRIDSSIIVQNKTSSVSLKHNALNAINLESLLLLQRRF